MRFEFHPKARVEFIESALFYENCQTDLGTAFTNEIELALEQISYTPDRWPLLKENVRGCLIRRFPYRILYTIEIDYILIVAIMHCSRKPGYWQNRIKSHES